ncbi:hypothetical protein AGDE_12430 [Angomonas deanei]|uniref:WD domain, G-beta repeat, putative n=1 Tax=Angomonas deanei TaxID=59799 RepID=A0A7G2CJN4_9TRYP|nr:hypothetical protein AGDE_12430 [Angomonas deanei]CAD2218472.1 WD domain, G-beta repeat, putative [Angomonas deanei]|eukprot:EPY24273.1 hypothetical protein AGDE_12430 [Angomonas deanei]
MLAQLHRAHEEVITSLIFSPHVPTVFCSTSGDDTACFWDYRCCIESGENKPEKLFALQYHAGPVNHALFLPDPNLFLTASDDCSLALWDLRNPTSPIGVVSGFTQGINKMLLLPPMGSGCLPPNSSDVVVASACDDGCVYIHSLVFPTDADEKPCEVGALLDKFMVSTYPVNDLAFLNNKLITATEDSALRSWNLQASTEDRMIATIDEFESAVNHVVVVPDPDWMGKKQEAAGGQNTDVVQPSVVEETRLDDDEGGAACDGGAPAEERPPNSEEQFSEWVLVACAENVFGVAVSPTTGTFGEEVRRFIAHTDYVRGLEFTNEKTLVTISDDCTAIEWDLLSSNPIRQVKLHDTLLMASCLSSDRTILATGTDSGDIRLWKLPFETECLTETSNK